MGVTAGHLASEVDALTPRINPGVCALLSCDHGMHRAARRSAPPEQSRIAPGAAPPRGPPPQPGRQRVARSADRAGRPTSPIRRRVPRWPRHRAHRTTALRPSSSGLVSTRRNKPSTPNTTVRRPTAHAADLLACSTTVRKAPNQRTRSPRTAAWSRRDRARLRSPQELARGIRGRTDPGLSACDALRPWTDQPGVGDGASVQTHEDERGG